MLPPAVASTFLMLSKFLKAVSKVTIPSAWRTDKTSENMIKYMKRDLIVPFEEGYLYKSIFGTE